MPAGSLFFLGFQALLQCRIKAVHAVHAAVCCLAEHASQRTQVSCFLMHSVGVRDEE